MSKYIDFEDPQNRDTYSGRTADPAWNSLFDDLMRPAGRRVVDIGCGGGIYLKAIASLRAEIVVGADSSHLSLESAGTHCRSIGNVSLVQTDAEIMGFADCSFDVALERALIHHLVSTGRNFHEVFRILKPGGGFWLQDRTVEDALLPSSQEHIRGFYLDFDQQLLDIEIERRRRVEEVSDDLLTAGFRSVHTEKIRELRKIFKDPAELRDEILTRRGRSLLHRLSDRRLSELADLVVDQITGWPVHERDTWTVWLAKK